MLLPGLLLRALIPVGFMPMFGPGMSVRLMLCQDYAPSAPLAASKSMDMGMDMPMDMPTAAPTQWDSSGDSNSAGRTPHSPQDHTVCPYAASSTLAANSAFDHAPPGFEPSAQPSLRTSQVVYSAITPRAQSARGPPSKI